MAFGGPPRAIKRSLKVAVRWRPLRDRGYHDQQMLSRRDLLKSLGAGLTVSAAAAPRFPKGAIIRTVLKDLPPEALAGGATLFHEHLSLAADFMPRWIALARAGRGQPAA